MSPSAHAYLAPSAASRWMLCPGSVEAATHFEDTSGYAAERGTLMHTYIEQRLQGLATLHLDSLDDEEQGIVDVCVDAANALIDGVNSGVAFGVENRVKLPHVHPMLWGTADLFVWHIEEGHLTVLDFKTGRMPVSPVANWQLIAYAAGVIRTDYDSLKRITLAVCQPRTNTVLSTWTTTPDDFLNRVDMMAEGAEMATGENAPRIPGAKQCVYCPARFTCPERMADEAHKMGDLFTPAEWFTEDTTILESAAKALRARIKEAERNAKEGRVPNVHSIGYELMTWTKAGREWLDDTYDQRAYVLMDKRLSPRAAMRHFGLEVRDLDPKHYSISWRALSHVIDYQRSNA